MRDEFKNISQHLGELQKRLRLSIIFLIVVFIFFYKNAPTIIEILVTKLNDQLYGDASVIYTHLPEIFLKEINISVFLAILTALPFFLVQIWMFLTTALYEHEKRNLKYILIGIPLLFYSGALFAYSIILPNAINFFTNYQGYKNLKFLPTFSDYLGFIQKLILIFGIGFELPIVLWALVVLKVITPITLRKKWRVIVFIICAFSAIFTPPDAISMLALAVPLIVLYILSFIVIEYSSKKKFNN